MEPMVAPTNIFAFQEEAPAPENEGGAMGFLGALARCNSQVTATSIVTASSEEAIRTTYEALIRDAMQALAGALGNAC